MIVTLLRTVILYVVVILALRVMGKRQIGELQPGELVITILISECAAAPIQDLSRPVISGIIAIFTLVILEILLSCLTLKWPFFRKCIDGSPAVIIKEGKMQQQTMKKLRLSVDDLTNNLRQMGYFNLTDIHTCLVETDGNLSVFPAPHAAPATAGMVGGQSAGGFPCVVIADGHLHTSALSFCGLSEKEIENILQKEKVSRKQVFLLSVDHSGEYTLIKKGAIS